MSWTNLGHPLREDLTGLYGNDVLLFVTRQEFIGPMHQHGFQGEEVSSGDDIGVSGNKNHGRGFVAM